MIGDIDISLSGGCQSKLVCLAIALCPMLSLSRLVIHPPFHAVAVRKEELVRTLCTLNDASRLGKGFRGRLVMKPLEMISAALSSVPIAGM